MKGAKKKIDEPDIEIFDKKWKQSFGTHKKLELSTKKELSDKKGSKSNGPYKEIVGEIRDKELFDKNRNKLDGNYRKLISDIPDEELFFDKEDTY